jgi:hypothetical protein
MLSPMFGDVSDGSCRPGAVFGWNGWVAGWIVLTA